MNSKNLNIIDSTKASPEIIERISYDLIFNEFISIITDGLEEFLSQKNVEITYEFYFKDDWEIPDRKNLILLVHIKNISNYRERLSIGSKISFFLRNKTEELINQSPTRKKKNF